MRLRYGMNPHQSGTITPLGRAPFAVVSGEPSYINVLDALTGWQLVREASARFGAPAAASYKHVSPAGAALGETVADAYLRARDADPKSSYGDFVAVSHPVDLADLEFEPPVEEVREVYGVRLTQTRDALPLTRDLLGDGVPDAAARDLLLGLIVARYTQSSLSCSSRTG